MADKTQEIKDLEAKLAALKNEVAAAKPVKLDIGCGKAKKEGFLGCDMIQFDGVDHMFNAGVEKWPFEDDSVDEIHASHFIEHLTWDERIHFFNEAHRVMKKGAKATLIWPHYSSDRYWGDPTHQQPLSPFAMLYLNAEWRKVNAPHVDAEMSSGKLIAATGRVLKTPYKCDFDHTVAYSLGQWLNGRNQEFIQFAMTAYREALQDIQVVLTKR